MMERGISRHEVLEALKNGEIIQAYPQDQPFPSVLVLDRSGQRPLHVVASFERSPTPTCYIITAYEPDLKYFQDDLKSRRR
jgi:hypothetical protein